MARGRRDLAALAHEVLRGAGLGAGDRLVVGLSGGVDSQTLTHLLARLRARGDGPDVRLVHVDHRLRPRSANDARQVERIAEAMELPLEVIPVDVEQWGTVLGQGTEAAARAARYAALARVATSWGTGWIAVGHNRDDQVETVILRLARGASLDGLAGMRPVSSRAVPLDPAGTERATIHLVRPLLGVRRSEIEAYADERQIVPVVDESNADPSFRRNALRHELIPALERIVPGAGGAIARNAELLADDVDLLNELAATAFEACCRQSGGVIQLDRDAFRAQPAAVQRRVVLLAVRSVSDCLELTRERVEALRSATLSGNVARRIEIGRGVAAFIDYRVVVVGPDELLEPELRRSYALPELAPDTLIAIERSLAVPAGRGWVIDIDLQRITPGWALRTRAPGDRVLLPDGRHKPLQDWFVDHKVPAALRDRLPLLVCDGEVYWVAGVSSDDYEDVHSRLTARLVKQTGDPQRDGEYAPNN